MQDERAEQGESCGGGDEREQDFVERILLVDVEESSKDVDHYDQCDVEKAVVKAGNLGQHLLILRRVWDGDPGGQAESLKCNHCQRCDDK